MRRIAAVLLVGAALGAVAWGWASRSTSRPAIVPAGTTRESAQTPGAFAGYAWLGGSVDSVAAAWRVPSIGPRGGDGFTATWIAAQADQAVGHPFLQVGVNELRLPSLSGHGYSNQYYAFWTDSVRRYVPVTLFTVRAGDAISARLGRTTAGWTVTVGDANGRSASFTTGELGRGPLSEADWIQEDVTNAYAHQPFPFPRELSPVRFTGVQVNAGAPDPGSLLSNEMAENGRVLSPGPLQGDAFTLHSTSGAGGQAARS